MGRSPQPLPLADMEAGPPSGVELQEKYPRPDQAWVGDITYIPTGEGWLYLAIVKDLCTRKIVGCAFSKRIDTQLALAALVMAYRRRKPQKGLIFLSDRGVQYASRAYRERLVAYDLRQSMSRRGDPFCVRFSGKGSMYPF